MEDKEDQLRRAAHLYVNCGWSMEDASIRCEVSPRALRKMLKADGEYVDGHSSPEIEERYLGAILDVMGGDMLIRDAAIKYKVDAEKLYRRVLMARTQDNKVKNIAKSMKSFGICAPGFNWPPAR